jgi:hypothetical protein
MGVRSKALAALGALTIALFCIVSVYNQFRITDTVMAMSPLSARLPERMRLASGWAAAASILSHLGLCFILAMLIIGLARLRGMALPTQSVVIAIGFAHVPLLLWAVYGTVLFIGSFSREQLELFGRSLARLLVARPFAYLCAMIWLVPLSGWQFSIGIRQAATLTIPPVFAIWVVLSILGSVINAIPK